MIEVTPNLSIRSDEYSERMVKASGPGGQHVNKTSNAIELRYDVRGSALADDVKERLERLAGSRLTQDGVLILFCGTHSQGSTQTQVQAAHQADVFLTSQASRDKDQTERCETASGTHSC